MTHAAGTEKERQNDARSEKKKNNKKITVGQKSTTTSRIRNKPTHYEVSSMCDDNSLPRLYRVDAPSVWVRLEFL